MRINRHLNVTAEGADDSPRGLQVASTRVLGRLFPLLPFGKVISPDGGEDFDCNRILKNPCAVKDVHGNAPGITRSCVVFCFTDLENNVPLHKIPRLFIGMGVLRENAVFP